MVAGSCHAACLWPRISKRPKSSPLTRTSVETIAVRLRQAMLLPASEVNDAHILAEAAALGCSILLTSDEHLRSIDFQRLRFELAPFELAVPVIAAPRDIVRAFF